MDLPYWRLIKKHDSSDVVLAVDFGPGRAEAGFAELAEGIDAPVTVLETTPGDDGRFASSATEQVRRWLDPVSDSGSRVRAVLGYCAGSAFARAIAVELGRRSGVPPVVALFDPEVVDAGVVGHQFRTMLSTFRGAYDDAALERTATAGEAVLAGAGADRLDHARDELVRLYAKICLDCFERSGLGTEFADELVERCDSYLRYLVLAAQVEPVGPPATEVVVCSRQPGSAVGPARDHHRLDVPRAELLSDPRSGRLVSELLS